MVVREKRPFLFIFFFALIKKCFFSYMELIILFRGYSWFTKFQFYTIFIQYNNILILKLKQNIVID